jgi:hypothetical protein
MLLHAFPTIFVSSLREFPETCVYKHGGLNCFIEYLHRKLLTANFLSYHRVKFYLYFLQVYDKRNYRITGNFCSVKFLQFWTNKKTFNFCGLFFLQIENLGAGKKMVCELSNIIPISIQLLTSYFLSTK